MIVAVSDDGNGARPSGGGRGDQPWLSELVWSLSKLSKEYEAQAARWAQIAAGQAEECERVRRAIEAYQAIPSWMPDFLAPYIAHAERAAQVHAAVKGFAGLSALTDLGRLPRGYYPPNWWAVDQLDVDVVVTIMREEGIPLAWVPRAAVIAELTAAPDAAMRDAILGERTAEIVEDCRQCLSRVLNADLQDLKGLAGNAVRALEQANPTAAQALAANVFDTLLRDVRHRGGLFAGSSGKFKYQHVTGEITPVSDETLIGKYRASCVLTPVLKALAEFNFETDTVPGRFARHATAHRAGTIQYTSANAVIAIMLATSLLREAQESGW
jgi:hypothetical protein